MKQLIPRYGHKLVPQKGRTLTVTSLLCPDDLKWAWQTDEPIYQDGLCLYEHWKLCGQLKVNPDELQGNLTLVKWANKRK